MEEGGQEAGEQGRGRGGGRRREGRGGYTGISVHEHCVQAIIGDVESDSVAIECPCISLVMKAHESHPSRAVPSPLLSPQVDPNTGVKMYESDDIIKYLANTYGGCHPRGGGLQIKWHIQIRHGGLQHCYNDVICLVVTHWVVGWVSELAQGTSSCSPS